MIEFTVARRLHAAKITQKKHGTSV